MGILHKQRKQASLDSLDTGGASKMVKCERERQQDGKVREREGERKKEKAGTENKEQGAGGNLSVGMSPPLTD